MAAVVPISTARHSLTINNHISASPHICEIQPPTLGARGSFSTVGTDRSSVLSDRTRKYSTSTFGTYGSDKRDLFDRESEDEYSSDSPASIDSHASNESQICYLSREEMIERLLAIIRNMHFTHKDVAESGTLSIDAQRIATKEDIDRVYTLLMENIKKYSSRKYIGDEAYYRITNELEDFLIGNSSVLQRKERFERYIDELNDNKIRHRHRRHSTGGYNRSKSKRSKSKRSKSKRSKSKRSKSKRSKSKRSKNKRSKNKRSKNKRSKSKRSKN